MCLQPFKRIFHWGPLTALGIIKVVSGTTVYCSGLWWPTTTAGGFINSACFLCGTGILLYNFLSAIFIGPGYLKLKWHPENTDDIPFLQYCVVCKGYKAPRAHHCKKCNRCVLKMDHHCPWINNCVGWGNQAYFITFIFFAVVCCIHSTAILSFTLYNLFLRPSYFYQYVKNVPVLNLGLYGLIFIIFAFSLSVAVVLAVGMILVSQVIATAKNRTGIEDWIVQKANNRRSDSGEIFIFPYDVGIKENIKQVFNLSFQPVGDGVNWPVREGCDQYTLTREQLILKSEKRERAAEYKIISPASGSWLPVSYGFRTFFHPPCTDESRLKLDVGDIILVTRWRKYWLYGEKILPSVQDGEPKVKGWFPRKCAIPIKEKRL